MNGPPAVESCSLVTADGESLEGQLSPSTGGDPLAVAVVCHPHPLYGGSMHNNVVGRLFADLPGRRVSTLRFNFRGVGASTGTHGGGEAEVADVVAAIDTVTDRHPGLAVVLAGYSFGADVSLSVGDDRISGWLAVSPPLRIVDPATMIPASDPRPTVVVTGTDDDFRAADSAQQVTEGWPSIEVMAAPGVDHFWMNGLDAVTAAADHLLGQLDLAP